MASVNCFCNAVTVSVSAVILASCAFILLSASPSEGPPLLSASGSLCALAVLPSSRSSQSARKAACAAGRASSTVCSIAALSCRLRAPFNNARRKEPMAPGLELVFIRVPFWVESSGGVAPSERVSEISVSMHKGMASYSTGRKSSATSGSGGTVCASLMRQAAPALPNFTTATWLARIIVVAICPSGSSFGFQRYPHDTSRLILLRTSCCSVGSVM